MTDAAMGSQELAIEWNPLRLFAAQGGGEESKGLPLPPDVLLQHATDGDNGCVDGEGQRGTIHGMDEHGGVGKSIL